MKKNNDKLKVNKKSIKDVKKDAIKNTEKAPFKKGIKTKDSNNKKSNTNKVIKDKNINSYIVRLPKNSDNVIEIKNLTKKFGNFYALNDVSINIKKGSRVGIIGANGAGKTTLVEIISGINKPTSGTVGYLHFFKNSPQERIGIQFQSSNYPSGLTVKHIIKFAAELHGIKLTKKKTIELLNNFRMKDIYNKNAKSLSGGQRQKLNILISLIHNPSLIILDEISTGLDVNSRKEILNYIDEHLRKNDISAIIISHHIAEIEKLCTNLVILSKGKVIEQETLKDFKKKHSNIEKYLDKIIDGEYKEEELKNDSTI